MARDPIARLLDPLDASVRVDAAADIEARVLRAYGRPPRSRVAMWGILGVAAAAMIGVVSIAATHRSEIRQGPGTTGNGPSASAATTPASDSTAVPMATTDSPTGSATRPSAYFTADLERMIGTEWSTADGSVVRTFPLGPDTSDPHSLADGSIVQLTTHNGNAPPSTSIPQMPLCTNGALSRSQTGVPLHADLAEARAFDVTPAGTVFAVRVLCPGNAQYGEADTGWELVSLRSDQPDAQPTRVLFQSASDLPDAAPDPHPSNLPIEVAVSDDGTWIFTQLWEGKISDTKRRYRWEVRRIDGGTAPLDLSGGAGCMVRTQPVALDAQHLVVACTLPFPTNGAGIRVSLVGPSGAGASWVAEYPTELAPDEVAMSVTGNAASPAVLLSWSTEVGRSWSATTLTQVDVTDETPRSVPGRAAWTLTELGVQDLTAVESVVPTTANPESATSTDNPRRGRYCSPTRNSVVAELAEPWVVLADITPGECSIVAADAGEPQQRVNLLSDGDVFTRVRVGDTTGWIKSLGLQAYELPALSGVPDVCRLADIATADAQYVSPNWGIQGCIDGWALLSLVDQATASFGHHLVQWDGQAWVTRYRFGENDNDLCNLDDPLLPAGLARNACTMSFDVTTGQLGNLQPDDLRIGLSTVADALRKFRLVLGNPTADSGVVDYPPLPGPEGSNCLRGQTVRVLQWGDFELGFDADGILFTWSLGHRSGDSFEPIIPPGDPARTPFLYASSGGPWIGWSRQRFIDTFGNPYVSPDGRQIGPLNPNDDFRPDTYFAVDHDTITGVTVGFRGQGC